MVGDGAASRVRHRRRERRHARSHAGRLRFAAALLRGRRHRVLTGFARARVRVQARRQGFRDVDDESRRVDRSRLRRRGEEADVEPGGGHDAGVLPGRTVDRRPRAAACGLRSRPLVSRRVRSRIGREAHAVHDARPVGGRLQVLARRNDDLVHRGAQRQRRISTRFRPPVARRRWSCRAERSARFSRRTDSPCSRSHRSSHQRISIAWPGTARRSSSPTRMPDGCPPRSCRRPRA